jgi:hypothetical protein
MFKIAQDIMLIHKNIILNMEELTYIFTNRDTNEPWFRSNNSFYLKYFNKNRSVCNFYNFLTVENRVKFINYCVKKHKFTIDYTKYLLTCSYLINEYFINEVTDYYDFIGHVDYDKVSCKKIVGCNCNKVFNRHLYEINLINFRMPKGNLLLIYEYIQNKIYSK